MADNGGTSAPVLSFPAILRNPGLKDRYAHLYGGASINRDQPVSEQACVKKVRRDQNEGKRWVRRKDNAHFVGNPYVVAATKKDYILPMPTNRPTFPEPLPSYLPRTAKVPATTRPTRDPVSANAGRFSLSIKGMRKELRRAGGRAEVLVREVESEMMEWLQGGVMLRPDESNAAGLFNLQVKLDEGREIGSTGIIEVSRSPLQLVWSIADDAFARYVVHCCARYHEVVSFSKGDSNERLTYLLRPNVRKPDYGTITSLETPPVTDADYSSQIESTDVDSDLISDQDLIDSDVDESPSAIMIERDHLNSIEETSVPSSSHHSSNQRNDVAREDPEWSVLNGDAGAYGDESGNYGASPPLRLSHHQQPPRLPSRRWDRSTSSPSRSPVRTRRLASARKKRQTVSMRAAREANYTSFYDYLFT
ncbi:hypothetical protein AN958_03530 [Leucoagaricus sp. SymC.cos]|nr:hypothetical protein AN958_03530 [Leucoagaricus sp. SymC.cos]